jgi:hypothetical protein
VAIVIVRVLYPDLGPAHAADVVVAYEREPERVA